MSGKSGPKPGDGPGPVPLKGSTPPPSTLDAAAKKHHAELSKLLDEAGILSILDADLLHVYCATWSTWTEAVAKTAKTGGKVIEAPNKYLQENPWHRIAVQAAKDMKVYLDMLGMSPKARIRLKFPEPDEPENKWDQFE